jgi:hypothetical protein
MKNLEEIKNEIVDLKDLMASYDLKFNLIESDIDFRVVVETENEPKFFNSYFVAFKYDKESILVRCFIMVKKLNGRETYPQVIYSSAWDSVKATETLRDHIITFCNKFSTLYYHYTDIQKRMWEIDSICEVQNLPKIIFNFE